MLLHDPLVLCSSLAVPGDGDTNDDDDDKENDDRSNGDTGSYDGGSGYSSLMSKFVFFSVC